MASGEDERGRGARERFDRRVARRLACRSDAAAKTRALDRRSESAAAPSRRIVARTTRSSSRDGTDPRERARVDAERQRRESSTFGTAFLQARVTREKIDLRRGHDARRARRLRVRSPRACIRTRRRRCARHCTIGSTPRRPRPRRSRPPTFRRLRRPRRHRVAPATLLRRIRREIAASERTPWRETALSGCFASSETRTDVSRSL